MTPDNAQKTIALALAAEAPLGWDSIWIEGEVRDDYSDLLFARSSESEDVTYFTPSYNNNEIIHSSLQDIRDQMQIVGRAKWNRCKFTLEASGIFHLHVDH